jgi:site-specific recombinase XerD
MKSKLKKLSLQTQTPSNIETTFAGWSERFLNYLRTECHLAPNTVMAYRRDLSHFQSWLDGRFPNKLKIDDLTNYLVWLKDQRLAASSNSKLHDILPYLPSWAFIQIRNRSVVEIIWPVLLSKTAWKKCQIVFS